MMRGTFSRSRPSEILFSGWPGAGTADNALALLFVFALCFLVEWSSHCRLLLPAKPRVATGILWSVPYALRAGLAYLAMLAVMSYDGGVFLETAAGHVAGFLAFASTGVFRKPEEARRLHVGEGHRQSASRELLIRGGSEVGGEILDMNMMA